MRPWRVWCAVILLTGSLGVAGPAAAADGILDRLRAVPGLTVLEERAVPAPFRFFVIGFEQPADHRHPDAGVFRQRFTLLHRATTRPMVLHTTGYEVPDRPFRAEPTRLLDANQISVEQRFFTPSRPAPADWSTLTIWQAATDHHRIVEALAAVYPANWISTGGSKGGMASVYHRRFYPSDVDGTVAYVAPLDLVDTEDSAFDRFFTTVGTDPACRAALNAVQVTALRRRTDLVARYRAWATANARTFTIVGGADRAFEFMVNGTTWTFWQYSDQSACKTVPTAAATTDEILTWLSAVYGLDSNTDQGIAGLVPYYYQSATQIGYPALALRHLRGLQRYPGQDGAEAYLPGDLVTRFEPLAMFDINMWVKTSGQRLLFVYGANDPWSAEPFRPGVGTADTMSFTAPGANHAAEIAALRTTDAMVATSMLTRWARPAAPVRGRATPPPDRVPALDDYRPVLDRRISR